VIAALGVIKSSSILIVGAKRRWAVLSNVPRRS
jgi:hypothetical protein